MNRHDLKVASLEKTEIYEENYDQGGAGRILSSKTQWVRKEAQIEQALLPISCMI